MRKPLALVMLVVVSGGILAHSAEAVASPDDAWAFATNVVVCYLLGADDALQTRFSELFPGPWPGHNTLLVAVSALQPGGGVFLPGVGFVPIYDPIRELAGELGDATDLALEMVVLVLITTDNAVQFAQDIVNPTLANAPTTIHDLKCKVMHTLDGIYVQYLRWIVYYDVIKRIVAIEECFTPGTGPGWPWLYPLDGGVVPPSLLPPCPLI